jgi:glycosyltransferase involved in cell wall biosynthesis
MPLAGRLNGVSYALTALELNDDSRLKRDLFGLLTKKAKFIVACETTRAYIMRYWYSLKKLPYVMPNKPYDFDRRRRKAPTCPESERAVSILKDKKFIIFQGLIHNREYLTQMARALRDSGGEYYFVLMGRDPENIAPIIKKEYEKTVFIGNIPAPFHLEVTSYAHIGFVFYDEDTSLNQAFCAPNKIYEYSGLGIPALGNTVPGLVNTVGASGAGVLCRMDRESIIAAINAIEKNYDTFSRNALAFYDKTDNEKVMEEIIADNELR